MLALKEFRDDRLIINDLVIKQTPPEAVLKILRFVVRDTVMKQCGFGVFTGNETHASSATCRRPRVYTRV